MFTKAVRCSAVAAGVLALGAFVSQAQAQNSPTFRLPMNGTLNGAGLTPFGGVSFGVGSGGGLLPATNLGLRALGYGGLGYGGNGIILPSTSYVPPLYGPPQGYGTTPVSYLYNLAPAGGYSNQAMPSYLSTNPGSATGAATLTTTPGYDPFYSAANDGNFAPVGSYSSGMADLVSASGNFMLTTQRARLLQEHVTKSQIDTRRRIWEEAEWERMHTVFTEDYRESQIRLEQRRARLEPPLTEIWSGKTLNVMLKNAATQQAKGNLGQRVPLAEDVLKHINLTAGTGGTGSVALFKSESLQWPTALLRPEFEKEVKVLNARIPDAKSQARLNGSVEVGTLDEIKKNTERLHDTLVKNVSEMTPSDYIEAKRYLNMLSDAVKALSDPNVGKYLTGAFGAKGKTVAELVSNMTQGQGLEFAPATPGDEPAYRALYQALLTYDYTLSQPAAPKPMDSGTGDK